MEFLLWKDEKQTNIIVVAYFFLSHLCFCVLRRASERKCEFNKEFEGR
jgi:hypothetical protein